MSKGIDDLLRYLVQQIALRSRNGATTDYVIQAVAQFYGADSGTSNTATGNATAQLVEDRTYLEQIWSWLTRNPDISLGQHPDDAIRPISLSEVETFNERLKESPVAQSNKSKANPRAPKGKANESDDPKAKHLRLFASEEQIWRALTGHGIDQRKVSALEFVLLTTIAGFREDGVTQPALPELTGQDKRSIPQRTSKLADQGYIIKKTIHTPGKITSRLILKQFAAGVESDRNHLSGTVDRESWSWQKFGKWMSILKDALKAVKDAGSEGIAWRDLRDVMTITRDRSKASKAIIDAMQRFRYLGCVDITRTVGYVPSETDEIINRIKNITHVRDVTDDDWTKFWSLGKDLTKNNGRRRSLSMTPGFAESQRSGSPDDEMNIDPTLSSKPAENAKTTKALSKVKPLWTPDRPLCNITFEAVGRAGTAGIITSQTTVRAAGKFFNRPLSTLLVDLSNSTWDHRLYASQHLQIVRDATQVDRYTVFKFHTFSNFQKMVDDGDKKWEWIGRADPKPESAGPFEFSDLSDKLFVDGEPSANLERCLIVGLSASKARHEDPKKVTGQAEPAEPGTATKVRKVRNTGAERPRKFKSTYTQEELDKMRPSERRAAINTVQNGRRYHFKQVEAKVMVRIKAGDDIEKAGNMVHKDIMVRIPRGDSAAKNVQLDVLPEILAKLRRETYPPSVAAHTIIYPGPLLRKMAPVVPKGRPPKPKPKATAKKTAEKNKKEAIPKPPKTPKVPKPAPLVRSKPIKSAIGYVASSAAHSQPMFLEIGSVVAVPVQAAPPQAKGRTAKSAIKALFGAKKNYFPSAAAHSDFSYHLSHKKEPKKRGRQSKKGAVAAPTTTSALEDAANDIEIDPANDNTAPPAGQHDLVAQLLQAANVDDAMDIDPSPELPSEPVISRSGREIKQTTKAIGSAALSATPNTNHTTSPLESLSPAKKKSVGALTYEEQYKWLRDEQTPGVYVGPLCSLKKTTKGRGPKSWLAVFRSPKLRDPTFVTTERPASFTADLVEAAQRQLDGPSKANSVAGAALPRATPPVRLEVDDSDVAPARFQTPAQATKRKRTPDDDGLASTKKPRTMPKPGSQTRTAQGPQTSAAQIVGGASGDDRSDASIGYNEVIARAEATSANAKQVPRSEIDTVGSAIGAKQGVVDVHLSNPTPKSIDVDMTDAQSAAGGAPKPVHDSQTTVDPSKNARGTAIAATIETDPLANGTAPEDDTEMPDTNRTFRTPAMDQVVRPEEHPPPSHVQNRVRTSQLSKATPVRGGAYSRPAPKKKPQPQPAEGVSRHGGSLMAERKNIIMDVVRNNGGFFAVGHEIWFPFATQWAKRHGPNRPDTRTIQNVIKQLVNEKQIKEYIFNFKDKGGILRNKKIIMLPEVSKDDPRIAALKKKVIQYFPHVYVPDGTEYDPALRRDPYKTGDPAERRHRDSSEGERPAPPRRPPGRPPMDPEQKRLAAQKRLQKAADKLAEEQEDEIPEEDEEYGTATFQLPQYDHDVAGKAKQFVEHRGQYDLAMKPNKQRILPKRMQDTENIDPNGPVYLPLPDYRAAGQTTRRQRESAIQTINLLGEATRSGINVSYDRNWSSQHQKESVARAAPRLSRRPPKAKQPEVMAPEGIQIVIDERSKIIIPQKVLAVDRLDSKQGYFDASGTFGTFLQIPGWFAPRDVDDILNHHWPGKPAARLASANSRDASFLHVVDRIKKWEMTDHGSFNIASNGWINLTPDSEATRDQRKARVVEVEEPRKKRRAPGTAPKEPRALERILALKRPGGRTNLEHPDAPGAKRRKTRGTRHRPQDPVLDRRILLAIIVTKIIYRAGDPRYVDWDIVRRVLGNEYSQDIIRKRYNLLRTPWKAWVAQTKKDLEERFLIAYEVGDLPTIDYDNIEQTEWTKVMAWVEEQTLSEDNKGRKRGDRGAVPKIASASNLTGSRERLEKAYTIKDYPNKADSFEIRYKGTRASTRREWQHEEAHIVPVRLPKPKGQVPTEAVARSWVRATALTAKERYDGYTARQKLETIPVEYFTRAERELFAHKALMLHTKNLQPGERPIDISQTFVANLRMNLGIFHHQEAVDFKQRLDTHFREESVVDFQQSADDGHMLALLNMHSQGMISFQARNIKSTPMGHLKNNYKTRTIDKRLLQFDVEIRPTARYVEGLIVESGPAKASGPKQTNEQGVDITPLPLWIDIHDNHEALTWQSALNVLFTICMVRPGITTGEIIKYVYPTLEAWELQVLMQWTVDAGLAQWVGGRKTGINLTPKWWLWMSMKLHGE